MYVQLTHLRPEQGCCEKLVAALKKWGQKVKDEVSPEYAFLSRAEDHIFIVAVYLNEDDYRSAVQRQEICMETIRPFLRENHGPTFSGEVLSFYDKACIQGRKDPVAHGIFI